MADVYANFDNSYKKYDIVITEYEKREKALAIDHFLVYLVNSKPTNKQGDHEISVWRRYNEFSELRRCLCLKYPYVLVPCLPEKDYFSLVKSQNELFVERRKIVLQSFLNRISNHPLLCNDPHFELFLISYDTFKSDNSQFNLMDSGKKVIKSLSTSQNSDKSIEDISSYMTTLNKSVSAVIKSNEKQISNFHLLSNTYANISKNMASMASSDSDNFPTWNKISQNFTQMSEKITETFDSLRYNLLLDKPNEICHLTEYFKTVYSEYVLLQTDYDVKNENYQKKEQYVEELRTNSQASSNVVFSAFKNVLSSNETYESRLTTAETQANEQKDLCDKSLINVKKFIKDVVADYGHFQLKKEEDLKVIMADQISVQIQICKMMLAIWNEIRSNALEISTA